MAALNKFDFAIFVFTPDDPIEYKSQALITVRDNVIFEAGLFIGRIGTERVFFVKPRNANQLKLPSDLLGVIAGEYDSERDNLIAALGPFCNKIKRKLKTFEPGSPQTLPQLGTSKIRENVLRHEVKILNDQGDAEVTKQLNFTIIEDAVANREHTLFCDSTPMLWEDLQIKAINKAGNILHIDLVRDTPNRKTFNINFKKCAYKGDVVDYSYTCFWSKMFPQKNEFFTFKMTAPTASFALHYPDHWIMQFIRAEQNLDGIVNRNIRIDNKLTQTADGFIFEEYTFDTPSTNTEIKVSWKRR